ncbi:DUF2147 domain-containing protein [Microbacter margulisiae]|uniref:Uncharacterized protein (DUF2147 family) n=1 Tax=Microbacter margulisiae TaxID=1350067 RepID=A0A7W5DT76_9PORP|nr:DUF2147 domain-containing protein [Microbacter margulisiae]MBB3188639.1 uncharacterized protein (DUF2147 family) [Microbacter margulisiae]
MKTKPFFLFLFVLISLCSSAEIKSSADRIIGYYYAIDDATQKASQVEIYRATDGKYYGKIVWLQQPLLKGRPVLDFKNPDKDLRNRTILGIPLLNGFVYNSKKDEWEDGTIYNPANGNTFHCIMKFVGNNRLKIRGYMGASWMGLGKTAYWPKENNLRE